MINIYFGPLFPWPFRLLAACGILLGLVLILSQPWVGAVIGLLGFLGVVAGEGTEINPVRNVYREYTSFLLFKTGRFVPYTSVEKIYINRSTESQQMYTAHTSHSSTFMHAYYQAYVKFNSGEKILLLKSRNKDKVKATLDPLVRAVEVSITDNT